MSVSVSVCVCVCVCVCVVVVVAGGGGLRWIVGWANVVRYGATEMLLSLRNFTPQSRPTLPESSLPKKYKSSNVVT